MRMPFTEFILSGDPKFVITFVLFTGVAIYHFVQQLKTKKLPENESRFNFHTARMNTAAFWILLLSVFSLLLGLMHSFYFIGKAGGIAPLLIFQGIANALATPVLGIALYAVVKLLAGILNPKSLKTT